jgi:histidinol-phosphate aminotransferase
MIPTDYLRLHLNEPTSDASDPVACYPDTGRLVAELARLHHIAPEHLLITPGADGAIEAACRATRGDIVLLDPDFPRYRYHAHNAQLSIRAVSIAEPPVYFPAERFLTTITSTVGTIILSTVGNPMGYRLPSATFVDTVHAHAPTALLVIDEVYSPFIGSDYTGLAAVTPGIVSLRSLSKVGFPGLRVGYAVGHPATLALLARYVSPYAVAGPSLVAASAAVRQAARWTVTIQRQCVARSWLVDQLHARGVTCYPSPANWVLVALGATAPVVRRRLAAQGILVQQSDHPHLVGYLRISTPDQPAVEHVVRA